ncbi:MAG: PEP-CTERM sorting domain-containing protein [Pirellula sp.]
MKFCRRLVLSLAGLFALTSQSNAGFIFDIGDVTTDAGMLVIVPVTVTTPDGTQFGGGGGFNLAVDAFLGATALGNGLPAGLTFDAIPVSGSAYFAGPTKNDAFNVGFNVDGIVNGNSAIGAAPNLVNNVPSTVFNLRFNVAPGVAAGTVFGLNFASNALTSATNSAGTALTLNAGGAGIGGEYALRSGSITITAIPEPSSIALTGIALLGAVVFARRRMK